MTSTSVPRFDDRGWSSSLALVNFSVRELGPGHFLAMGRRVIQMSLSIFHQ
jgi:hypothetical protein